MVIRKERTYILVSILSIILFASLLSPLLFVPISPRYPRDYDHLTLSVSSLLHDFDHDYFLPISSYNSSTLTLSITFNGLANITLSKLVFALETNPTETAYQVLVYGTILGNLSLDYCPSITIYLNNYYENVCSINLKGIEIRPLTELTIIRT